MFGLEYQAVGSELRLFERAELEDYQQLLIEKITALGGDRVTERLADERHRRDRARRTVRRSRAALQRAGGAADRASGASSSLIERRMRGEQPPPTSCVGAASQIRGGAPEGGSELELRAAGGDCGRRRPSASAAIAAGAPADDGAAPLHRRSRRSRPRCGAHMIGSPWPRSWIARERRSQATRHARLADAPM